MGSGRRDFHRTIRSDDKVRGGHRVGVPKDAQLLGSPFSATPTPQLLMENDLRLYKLGHFLFTAPPLGASEMVGVGAGVPSKIKAC